MTLPACAFRIPLTDKLKGREIGGIKLSVNMNQEEIYQELRRRAVVAFGEDRAVELEDYLRVTAGQVADVEGAVTHPDLEPLFQE